MYSGPILYFIESLTSVTGPYYRYMQLKDIYNHCMNKLCARLESVISGYTKGLCANFTTKYSYITQHIPHIIKFVLIDFTDKINTKIVYFKHPQIRKT